MIYGMKFVFKYLAGLDHADRNFMVYPDDTMLVSYPRSGNTWARFLIANLLHPAREIGFADVEAIIPDTSTISSRALKRIPRPRIIKSHEYFDHRYPRVIYIVRDPRDVALSLYDFQRKYRQLADDYPTERYADDFVYGRVRTGDWGTWGENVGSWFYTRHQSPNFLLLRYEDMLEETQGELARIARFMNVSASDEQLYAAVEKSSSGRMRMLEKKDQDNWVGSKTQRKDIPFVRTARSGNWQSQFSAESVTKIENQWGELMSRLGYPLAGSAPRLRRTGRDEDVPIIPNLQPAIAGSGKQRG